MPGMGLELYSAPCEYWEVAETCGIRPDSTGGRPGPKPQLWTVSTLLLRPF